MPDDSNNPVPAPVAPKTSGAPEQQDQNEATSPSVVVEPSVSVNSSTADTPADLSEPQQIIPEVIRKITDAENVLVALASNPSVDEMAAAIGLTLFLDKIGKHATAIYSGTTPNALEFLKPEETFEPTADVLQDFVIALNKEKADHLRYKLDGDFVKIYITPYHSRISEEDLEFSYGNFNVDLVLALDVSNGADLNSALREHGRIMHDAPIVNITTGNPGKLGEIEWSDKSASSVSEMIAGMLYDMGAKSKIEPEEATAFLTGIVAATDRFSSASTTPRTMKIASKLMESGANQQLISQNITADTENEIFNAFAPQKSVDIPDPTSLNIKHQEEVPEEDDSNTQTSKDSEEAQPSSDETAVSQSAPAESTTQDQPESSAPSQSQSKPVSQPEPTPQSEPSSQAEAPISSEPTPSLEASLLDDLQAAAASLAQAGTETVPSPEEEPIQIDSSNITSSPPEPSPQHSFAEESPTDYGQMLDNALASVNMPEQGTEQPISSESSNPALMSAPAVPSNPEINGVPEINYMPMPGEELLPPPPAPPIDPNLVTPEPTIASFSDSALGSPDTVEASTTASTLQPLGPQPAMQDQVYTPQAADPNAFKIPGM